MYCKNPVFFEARAQIEYSKKTKDNISLEIYVNDSSLTKEKAIVLLSCARGVRPQKMCIHRISISFFEVILLF